MIDDFVNHVYVDIISIMDFKLINKVDSIFNERNRLYIYINTFYYRKGLWEKNTVSLFS